MSEPTDPAEMKADMQKCPRWILAKLQSERKNRTRLEADLSATIPEFERSRAELEGYRARVKLLEEEASANSSISQVLQEAKERLQSVEDAIKERDASIIETESQLEARKEELTRYKRFVKELQETKTKEHHQLKDSLIKMEANIQEKQELINKLKQDLSRYGSFLRTRVQNPPT